MKVVRFSLLAPIIFYALSVSAPEFAKAWPWPYVAPPYTCGTNYYVAPTGNDSNSGSSAAPWRTISRAIAVLSNGSPKPGVCVNVAPGTYTESLYLYNLNGGWDAPNGYLVFRSSTLRGATLQEPYADIYSRPNVAIHNSRYVIFDGFHVKGYRVPYAGASAFQAMNSHHIKFINNIVHDVGGAGIVSIYSDYVYAQANIVYYTSCCSSSGVSGINYYAPVATDQNPGFHNVISSNIVFGNSEGASGRRPHTEGHGIALDKFRFGPAGPYPAKTLVENNLVYENGGAGIVLFYTDNVTIRNNTAYHNRRDPLIPNGEAEITVINSSHVTGVNNVTVADISSNPNILSIQDQTTDRTNIGNVWKNNLTFNGRAGQSSVGDFAEYGMGTPITAANGNILGADPRFVDPVTEFRLLSTSPAIGKGTAAYGVPALDLANNVRSWSVDMGAYAFNVAR